jgi:dienelactone hydrolase
MAGLFAVSALVVVFVAVVGNPSLARAASPVDDRFVTSTLPNSPAGRQMQWLIDASARLPVSETELRAHLAKQFLAMPGYAPAQTNKALSLFLGPTGMHLKGVVALRKKALVAVVSGRAGHEVVVTLVIDRAGLIAFPTSFTTPATLPAVALPSPSGHSPVGSDLVQLLDPSRGGRRLMLTRWYPATASSRHLPLSTYASVRLSTVIGLPHVRIHAHAGARALPGRLPVVLFSPGGNTPRVLYQAFAEDLASHGYLVIGVDHTGEAPVEFPHGDIQLPTWWTNPPNPKTGFDASLRGSQRTRVQDLQFVLRHLGTMPRGPVADLTRIASMGHSLGGSTSAALMRIDRRIVAGIDLDGSIFGPAAKRGVPRPFLFLGEGGLDSSVRGLLTHSSGARFGLNIAGLQHMSFSDVPVLSPAALRFGKWHPSARDIIIERTYVRAFLDRYLLGISAPLLDESVPHDPRVSFSYTDSNG